VIQIVWEFRVRPGMEAEFERRYAPSGDWARLFAKAEGFLGTTLLRDPADPGRYVSIDAWADEGRFAAFKRVHAAAYAALDRECEALTESEVRIGSFEALP
jgi:heme-degrading monooxygenase HmoA